MALKTTEAYYHSSDGMDRVHAMIWADPDLPVRGVVQIAHGVCEHIARYAPFARFLTNAGFVVCGNDHLGHGRTAPVISDLGFVEEGSHLHMIRDMRTLHMIMRKRYPETPYFIFGHSMGSFMARLYAAQFSAELAGAVFCGTMQLPAPLLLMNDPVQTLMDRLPQNTNMGELANLAFGKVTRRLLKEDDDLAWISKSKENLKNWRDDPYCGFPIPWELARELVTLAVLAGMPRTANRLPEGFPVMLISGGRDPVGFFGRGVIAAADQLMSAGIVPDVILYPGDRHEILNEEDREKVYSDVLRFLNGALAPAL